jgi:hypothetical protein
MQECRLVGTVSSWPRVLGHAIYKRMSTSGTCSLPNDLASALEREFFWWEPVGLQPRSDARILAQAMSLASFEDVRRLEKALGPNRLVEAMLGAQPGWISERSWEFWRGRLALATGRAIPEAPPRRSFDVGSF